MTFPIDKAIGELLSHLGETTELVDNKTHIEVKRKYKEDNQNYLILIDYWVRTSSAIFGYMRDLLLIKSNEGISYNKQKPTHAYLEWEEKKHDLHSLNKRTNSDCLPVAILVLFLVKKTNLDVETIQEFLEEHQNYLGDLLESTRFFLYLVGSLDEDQSVEILFNLMFFLKGEHQTESKTGKKSESKISYNERVVSQKEGGSKESWPCTVCTFNNSHLMENCEMCSTSK
jgi:hypothetical protein